MNKIIETKSCTNCGTSFDITDRDMEFYNKISPVFAGKKCQIPNPKLCPDCRQQRRLAWRNERKLYRRKCDFSGKSIISSHSEAPAASDGASKTYKIYEQSIWRSDQRDPMTYAKEIDFSKPFLDQFKELMIEVPQPSLSTNFTSMTNSEYNNQVGYLKNCYMLTNSDYNEDCYYGKGVNRCFKCVDNHKIYDCEMLYQCANCNNCTLSHYLFDSETCSDCFFSTNLLNCNHCFGCFNLVGQKYCFFNEQLSKEEWEIQKKDFINKYTYSEILQRFLELSSKRIVKYMEGIQIENATGNYLKEVSACDDCYDCENTTDSKFCSDIKKGDKISANNYDINYFGVGISNSYENDSIGYDADHIMFSSNVWDKINNCYYCFNCFLNSSNLFGCVGLRNKEYCILNKQYTQAEYEDLVTQIIHKMIGDGERGEFFDPSLSPFAYNETVAQEYFPLTKQDALSKGYARKDEDDKDFAGPVYVPLSIDQYNENMVEKELAEKNINNIINGILKCEVTGRPFRIIKQELEFYIKHNLTIPARHPDQRHLDRIAMRNPRKLWDRKCMKCEVDIKTTYSPERKEIVYCEACYNREVYG